MIGRGERAGLEALECAQPRGGEYAVAIAETVVEGADRRPARRGDGRDACRPRSVLRDQGARGVEDHVGGVLARWCHVLVRALVIGSGGHKVVVRRMLRRIAAAA